MGEASGIIDQQKQQRFKGHKVVKVTTDCRQGIVRKGVPSSTSFSTDDTSLALK